MRYLGVLTAAGLVTALAAGCNVIAGLGDFEDATPTGVGGSAGAGGSSGTGGSTSGGGGTGGGFDQPPASHSVSFGSEGMDTLTGLAVDQNQTVYFAGTHGQSLTIGNDEHTTTSDYNLYLAALQGQQLAPSWSHSWPLSAVVSVEDLASHETGSAIITGAVSSDINFGGELLTTSDQDAYVARFDADGTYVFSNLYGSPQAQAGYAVAPMEQGFVLGGTYNGDINIGTLPAATAGDGFFAQFTANNVPTTLIGAVTDQDGSDSGAQDVRALAVNEGAGRLYVAGIHKKAAEHDGVLIPYGGGGSRDAYVLVVNTDNGDAVDRIVFTSPKDIVVQDLVYTGSALVVVGNFSGALEEIGGDLVMESVGDKTDGFIIMLSTNLVIQAVRRIGGTGDDVARSVDADSEGNVIVVGGFDESADVAGTQLTGPFKNAFVLKLDQNLDPLWAGSYGGAGNDQAWRVAVHQPSGSFVVGGTFANSIDFGQGPLETQGMNDLFIARFPAD